ncbi:MAG TPA: protein kinase [Thermoanaerobaculia bacterium]|nr:protein kinase [Thermoanaerobaculia bacterium]
MEQTLGRYRLVSLLGEGGMGKVYKAHDAALDRHVAIKILPPELLTDASRVARFIQEARAASALSHPHVLTVYDIGEADNVRYMAMELIEGKTLREQMLSGPADLRKALKVVLQVAEALTAAHAAGIVHRDLKPENIMISSAGYAKVLDFGLAKLWREPSSASETASRTAVKGTDPGMVMGTAGYMSPEQARGDSVDHRSDLFSLGCVLYELVSGRRAFRGDSSVDTMHKVIYDEADPIRSVRADVPAELARILRKALAKDPDDRYQTAKDLAIDLRELLRELDTSPGGAAVHVAATPSRPRLLWPVLMVLAIAAVAAGLLWQWRTPAVQTATPSQLRITRVTASGKVTGGAISRDGKFVAYSVSDQGEQSLWVRQMTSGQSLELIPMERTGYWGMSFSPDGDIYYGVKSSEEPAGAIYQISPLGGAPRRIIGRIDTPPTFAPDGKRIGFLRAGFPTANESAIIIANIDGSGEKTLATVRSPELFVPVFYGGASWSPDGTQIATAVVNREARKSHVVGVDVASGAVKPIAQGDWVQVAQVAWLPDGGGLLAVAFDRNDTRSQVWYIPYPGGSPTQITNDLFDYRIVSLTADGKSLMTVAAEAMADIWVAAPGALPKKITNARLEGSHGLATLPDGRIVASSLETGKLDLWIMNRDGSGRTLLTRDEHENRWPVATPDGKSIVYLSVTSSGNELCTMGLDGSNRRVLATGLPPDTRISVSPDSKWVAYHVNRGEAMAIARVSIDGGEAALLTDSPAEIPEYSPDGSQMAFYALDAGTIGLSVMSAAGAGPVKRLDSTHPFAWSGIRWTSDGTALVINTAPSDRANLWLVPLDGSDPRRITNFEERMIMAYAPLPGEKGWVVARGDLSRDAVLITGFRP